MSQPVTTPNPWTGISLALQALQSGTLQPQTVQLLIDSLCQLNLGGIAVHILSGLNATGEFAALKERWLTQARAAQEGKVAWASRKRRFAANIAALAETSPDLAALPAFWDAAQSRYELYLAADGNVLVYDTQVTSPFAAVLGSLRNHMADATQWTYQKSGPQLLMPIAMSGAGYGWLLTRILETTTKTFVNYSCAIYLVEPDPAAICMLLHVQDLRSTPERLRFFVGDAAADRFAAALRERTSWSIPGVFASAPLTLRPAVSLEPLCNAVTAERKAHLENLKRQADAYYASLPLTHWQQRFADALAGTAKLTVVGLTTRYSTVLQYSMAELGAAIEAAGHTFILAIESDDQSLERPELDLIANHKPDLIVQISRMRYENPWLPRQVPFLCWDQDNLPCMRTPAATASLDAFTYVAGPGANIGFARLGWPRRNCVFVRPAGQWHRYARQVSDPALLQKYAADFSYISNASVRPEDLYADTRKQFASDPRILAALDQAAHQIITGSSAGGLWPLTAIRDLLLTLIPGLDLASQTGHNMEFALQTLADRAFRHATLQWVADYCRDTGRTLRLYGSGWEKNPSLSQYAGGVAQPGDPVLAIYRASRINLQIIETGFTHSRLLDGIAAGGFFLCRLSPLDYSGSPMWRSLFWLVDWVQKHHITATDQFGALATDEVHQHLPAALKFFGQPAANDTLIRELIIQQDYKPTRLLAPRLAETEFATREDFVRLADHYLNNEPHRAAVVTEVAQIMKGLFSYDTRWREFLTGIHTGLTAS